MILELIADVSDVAGAAAAAPAKSGFDLTSAIIGGLLTLAATIAANYVGVSWTEGVGVRERQKTRLRDLQRDFFVGDLLLDRLKAEHLFLRPPDAIKEMNLKQMYEGGLTVEDYKPIAVVLNFFRLLNAYKESGFIDERQTREDFGWAYTWWWFNVIEPYGRTITDPAWEPHLRRHDWLLRERAADAR